MKKMIIIMVIAALLIGLTAFYFTQTNDGLITRIMWKYPPDSEARKASMKLELSTKTIEELQYILKFGGG